MSKLGFWFFQARDNLQIVFKLPTSVKRCKEKLFFISGEGWEYQETEIVGPVTPGINLVWGDPDLNEIGNIQPKADDLEDIIKAIKKKLTGYSELVTPEKLFSLLLGHNLKDGVEIDESALSRLRGHQTIGMGKPSTPKLKIDKNVLAQAVQAGASAMVQTLGKRKRKIDQTSGLTTKVASEVSIGSNGRTLSQLLSPSTGLTDPVKTEVVKSKGPIEAMSGQEVGDATKEATGAVEEAQAGRSTAEQAQKVVEDKLVATERMLVEERKKIEEMKDLGQSKAALSTAMEDFKVLAEYLAEKTLYFVGGFEQAKKAFQKKFPEADLEGIEPESPSEGETMTEAEQSGDEEVEIQQVQLFDLKLYTDKCSMTLFN
ncbi:hypothetical protein RHSIM_Rhsim03G0129200 [Rhododendron simsii]|uniref:Uncharacterized protein n=1 Tax=Rhododendron simsii TaxID=118357 RepID=A0A834LSX1_RHOSS|nr:hypothetical protein RHSIM_Rhsim03G0129200 [Rhododendron simsii]